MTTETKQLIKYEKRWEWNGYTLMERQDGLWVYEQWSGIQGSTSGRKLVIEPPAGWSVQDDADMDTHPDGNRTKAEILWRDGPEVRCLRRGELVQ